MATKILAPSILSADFVNLSKDIALVEKAGAQWLHIDVMDGHFVPNITIGPVVLKDIRRCTKLFLDVHLMIEAPEKYIEQFAQDGADLLCLHLETLKDPKAAIQKVKALGKKIGLAVNPDKKFDYVKDYLQIIDMVLFMSVFPGFAGQKFIPTVLEEVKKCRNYIDQNKLACLIEIDGGINRQTALDAIAAGVDVLVAGSAIYKANDPVAEIKYYLNL